MSTTAIIFAFFIASTILEALAVWWIYNSLVEMRNRTQNAWSQIDVQLKRRHDLIPNLVETVRGFAAHEKETLESVIRARTAAVKANGIEAQQQAEGMLSGALGRLMMLTENYPELQANQNFLSLQEELTSTENRITYARQAFNEQVLRLNDRVEKFPSNLVARIFRFERGTFFTIEEPSERKVPQVTF